MLPVLQEPTVQVATWQNCGRIPAGRGRLIIPIGPIETEQFDGLVDCLLSYANELVPSGFVL